MENKTYKDFFNEHHDTHPEAGRDISEMSRDEIFKMVYTDSITGFYNWAYMWKFLDPRFRTDSEYCFVHFDIKNFNMVNIIYGHKTANKLLRSICVQILSPEESDWIIRGCRCDNDNFSMMVKPLSEKALVEKLTAFFNKISFLPDDHSYKIYFRCGVVTAKDAIYNNDTVADYAKFAQKLGKKYNCTEVNFFTNEMYEHQMKGRRYLAHLDQAIENDEFVVYMQPKYCTQTEKITGAEALVRWNYQKNGLIPPGEFIPAFERFDVISKVDQVVLEKVCAFTAELIKEGITVFPVSVNLSRRRIGNVNLKSQLIDCVDKYCIPHNLIEFELTESISLADMEALLTLLKELREDGFPISMDDFGTGYSSLSLLKTIPMDTLKIDKCFVDSILTAKEGDREIILLKDIISLSKHLGLCCLAEGAETKEQVEYLKEHGCDKIQGYYYSKPVPMETYKAMLKEQEQIK